MACMVLERTTFEIARGTMIKDHGFDLLGFAKSAEYLQFDLDSVDQNLVKNVAGEIIGTRLETTQVKLTPFQPYTELFRLQRFRECELIHGRRAMLGALGALTVKALTSVAWQDAGKIILGSMAASSSSLEAMASMMMRG